MSRWETLRQRVAVPGLALASLLPLLLLLDRDLAVLANDDAFIYFNYARNFALGRPFAYDPRGIPSEGFTSPLYLLLLVPFELARANPMAAAIALNLAGVGLAGLAAARIHALAVGGAGWSAALGALVVHSLAGDANVRGMVGFGLESTLNGAALMGLLASALAASRDEGAWRARGFWAMAFGCVLVRPENAAIGGLLAASLLAASRRRGALLGAAAPVALVAAFWLAAKWWLFGDLLPTGFYRKVEVGSPEGARYVLSLLAAQPGRALLCAALLLAPWLPRAAEVLRPLRAPFGWAAGAALLTLLIFANVRPLVGHYHRFLVFPIFVMHWVPAAAAVLLAQRLWIRFGGAPAARSARTAWVQAALLLALATPAAVAVWRGAGAGTVPLLERAARSMDGHPYIAIGRALRRALAAPQEVVLVFGDAGGVPYELGSRFIDPNGLTEPYIARLFAVDDEPQRLRRYTEYILSQDPDLIVVGYGQPRAGGRVPLAPRAHGPLPEDDLGYERGLVAAGFRYLCSLRSYHDLHFGVNPGSRHFADVARAVTGLCRTGGYVLPGGLRVEAGGESVAFPPLARGRG